MGKYTQLLDQNYADQGGRECPPVSKLDYLGDAVFDFTTYDSEASALLASKMIPVLQCILDKKTFDFQDQSKAHYLHYLIMVNMPFLVGKLEWGCSIRGAWFDDHQEYEIAYGELAIKKGELTEFITDLLEWVQCGEDECK